MNQKNDLKNICAILLHAALCMASLVCVTGAGASPGNINPASHYAWSENAGWLNFRPGNGGVRVLDYWLSGYAWAEGVGWVKLGSDSGGPYANTTKADWGVNRT